MRVLRAYSVTWGHDPSDPSGQQTAMVRTWRQLVAVLDQLTATGPWLLMMYPGRWSHGDGDPPHAMQLVWGHPQRAAMTWLGEDAADAVDPDLLPWSHDIGHDQDAASPRRTRVTPEQVRAALREYLRTGRRPKCVTWVE